MKKSIEHLLAWFIRKVRKVWDGSELTADLVRSWPGKLNVKTLFIEPGSLWENGYNESFNGKWQDELLNGEIFYILREAQIIIEQWRKEYNTIRPHSSLNYRPPTPEAFQPAAGGMRNRAERNLLFTYMKVDRLIGTRQGGRQIRSCFFRINE